MAILDKFGDLLRRMQAAFAYDLSLSTQEPHRLSFDHHYQIHYFLLKI